MEFWFAMEKYSCLLRIYKKNYLKSFACRWSLKISSKQILDPSYPSMFINWAYKYV